MSVDDWVCIREKYKSMEYFDSSQYQILNYTIFVIESPNIVSKLSLSPGVGLKLSFSVMLSLAASSHAP